MIELKIKKPNRMYIYLYLAIFLFNGYYLLDRMNWTFDIDYHTIIEIMGSILSVFIAILAYIRYFTKKNNMYLFISTGFLVEGTFKGMHAIFTSRFLIEVVSPNIIAWTCMVSRIVFPSLLLFSYITWKKENNLGEIASVNNKKLYLILTFVFVASFILFLLLPGNLFIPINLYHHLDTGNFVTLYFSKLPLIIYIFAIFFYLKKRKWESSKFEHWLIISLIVNFKAELISSFAASSSDLIISHLYKNVGYFLLLIGLTQTMYQLFKRAEESATEIKTMNNSLSKEIFEKHYIEESLRENEERYRLLVEHSPDLIAVNSMGKWSYINTTGRKLLGASCKSEIIDKKIIDFIHPEDQEIVQKTIAKIIETGRSDTILERRLISLDGRVIYVEIQAIVTDFQEKQSILIMARDVTEQKKTEELLRRSEKLSVVGEIAAGIAHEIRNPLTSMNGFIQLMQSEGSGKEEYYNIMLSELNRIENIISELLVLAEPHSNEKQLKNVCGLMDHVITLYRQEASRHNIDIIKDSEATIPLVLCEENQLKQVFINIVKNAIEAMPNGGTLLIEVRLLGEFIRIRFADQGIGIPADILEKLGKPFVTTKDKGTGLGLMICRKIIDNHQGKLEFTSQLGEGTMIDIYLPV